MAVIPSFLTSGRKNVFDPFSLDVWDPFQGFPFSSTLANVPSSSRETAALANTRIDWKETPEAHIFKVDLPSWAQEGGSKSGVPSSVCRAIALQDTFVWNIANSKTNCFSPTGSNYEEEEFATEGEVKNEPGKAPQYPYIPKEEEMSEDELERMLEKRYKTGTNFVTYAGDGYEHKTSTEGDIYLPSAKDPTIWKVKCLVCFLNFWIIFL
ncbi:unnamed protein product [Fraxinus pennsylvanica]|uniref:Uncharacterized protein n=1 Tax=Fraxinus pennsylvanica TaxID=56036 RepID=A0AAD2E366_9LAMI|nr:unnamed protein product [Fraxinus pennsylvanica]